MEKLLEEYEKILLSHMANFSLPEPNRLSAEKFAEMKLTFALNDILCADEFQAAWELSGCGGIHGYFAVDGRGQPFYLPAAHSAEVYPLGSEAVFNIEVLLRSLEHAYLKQA